MFDANAEDAPRGAVPYPAWSSRQLEAPSDMLIGILGDVETRVKTVGSIMLVGDFHLLALTKSSLTVEERLQKYISTV